MTRAIIALDENEVTEEEAVSTYFQLL